jgi:hypothetical protein
VSSLYHLVEPALVGGGVLLALGAALRRFWPRRRDAAGAGACSSCSGCGGCGSGPAKEHETKPIALVSSRRKPGPGVSETEVPGLRLPPQ